MDRCYRPEPFPNDWHRVENLFAVYEKLTAPLVVATKPAGKEWKRRSASQPSSDSARLTRRRFLHDVGLATRMLSVRHGVESQVRVSLFQAANLAGVGSARTKWHVDMGAVTEQSVAVKHMRPAREPKTKGTLIVEQHRPVMNKLSDTERQQLMRAGMELIYGVPAASQSARRRR